MQFKDKIAIAVIRHDEFASEIAVSTIQAKCFILQLTKKKLEINGAVQYVHTAEVLIPAKSVIAYSDFFYNDKLRFIISGISFHISEISPIRDFSGKTRFYEVNLEQVKNANR